MAEPRKPKKLYRVVRTSVGTKHPAWRVPNGQTYEKRAYAEGRAQEIGFYGGTAEIYVCEPVWRKLEEGTDA